MAGRPKRRARQQAQGNATKKPKASERIAQEMIERLKNGTAPWTKPWRAGMFDRGPINAATGKPYGGANRMMLEAMQPTDDPRWVTYNQAQKMNAQVVKGAKSVPISIWITSERRLKRDEDGKPILDDEGNKQYRYVRRDKPYESTANVFHASDVEGLPPYQPHQIESWQRQRDSETVLEASGARIRHDGGDRAFYRPIDDVIFLPQRSAFPTADNYYATALHELGHWTGAPTRLDRGLLQQGGFGSPEYALEELRAELFSTMLGRDLGIGHDPDRHAAYVGSWLRKLEDDPTEILRAAKDAEKMKSFVLDFAPMLKHQISNGLERTVHYDATPLDHVGNADEGVYLWHGQDSEQNHYYALTIHPDNDAEQPISEVVTMDCGPMPDCAVAHEEAFSHGERWCEEQGIAVEAQLQGPDLTMA